MEHKSLTDQKFWESYYAQSSVDKDRVIRICGIYNQLWDKLYGHCEHPGNGNGILEIGGYPGRYLAYLADRFQMIPTSIDFNPDTEKIREVFALFDITDYDLIRKDVFTFSPSPVYDIVFSMGFIEHFEDFAFVMDLHAQLLKPGGTLLIMVPNKRYLRKWYGKILDRDDLKAHNLKCMNRKTFNAFRDRNDLEEIHLDYFGGFAFNVHHKLNFWQNLLYQPIRLFFKQINPLLARFPAAFYSASLIGIYKKPL